MKVNFFLFVEQMLAFASNTMIREMKNNSPNIKQIW